MEYFRLITDRDVQGLVDLFDEECVIYEPFSKEDGLHGKDAIRDFFSVAVMANAGMRRTIRFSDKKENGITALVTFERGGSITGQFQYDFVRTEASKKIKQLRIQFIQS